MRIIENASIKLSKNFLLIYTQVLDKLNRFEIDIESSWVYVLNKIIDQSKKLNYTTDVDDSTFKHFTVAFLRLFTKT